MNFHAIAFGISSFALLKMGFKLAKAFGNAIKAFFKESSLAGLQYLVNPSISFFEKCIWAILEGLLFSGALIMIFNTMKDNYDHPLVINLETTKYPIENIPFPAVSICNINKISMHYTFLLAVFTAKNISLQPDLFPKFIKIFGALYSPELETLSDVINYHQLLEEHEISNDELFYFLSQLNTPCSKLLTMCKWKNKDEDCSTLFEMQQTYEGFCCIFNYVRETNDTPQFLDKSGIEHGLTVAVINKPDDYLYPVFSTVGVNVHIFNPYDYPDIQSGGLKQNLVAIGTEAFLGISADTLYSDPHIRRYPTDVRNCFFGDEGETLFGNYSLTNCLVECKWKSILAQCECSPFTLPSPYSDTRVCGLLDILCLAKNSDKWENIYPDDVESEQLEEEKQSGLRCYKCCPGCSSTDYHISGSYAPLYIEQSHLKKYENHSVIRIYFESNYGNLYKREVVSYWFEILSNIGGILSIFVGFSMITIVEFFYFLIFRLKS